MPPAPPPDYSKNRAIAALVGFLGFIVVLIVVYARPPAIPAPIAPARTPLNISAGRGIGGFELTNRESSTISDCAVAVMDDGNTEWMAKVFSPLPPLGSRRLSWNRFEARGQEMPPYVGLNRKTFTVSCGVDGERRFADLSF
jgi:hypothetical protein